MSGEIIRVGDPTSHGGKVLEGSLTDICHGKPIAYLGHKTQCPKCKGTFPIIEGALTTSFYGKGVALAGMKTACGATLIATQFSDTVEYGQAVAAAPVDKSASDAAAASAAAKNVNRVLDEVSAFDLFFHVKNESGAAFAHTPYKITLEDGREFFGKTDEAGHTQKVCADTALKATIKVPYYEHCDPNAAEQSGACGC